MTRPRLPSIRSQIALLVLACALPALIAFAAVVRELYVRERSALIDDSRQRAHNIALALDAELVQLQYQAALLDPAPGAQAAALDAWRSHASALLGAHIGASQIMLSDLQGQPLRHTGSTLPAAMGPDRNPRRLQALWSRPQATLSRLDDSPTSPLLLDLPLMAGGQLRYALTLLLPPEPISHLLATERRSPQQVVVLYDAQGRVLVSTSAPAAGQLTALTPALATQLAHTASTVQPASDAAGADIHLAASRAPRSGLIITIATPQALAIQQLQAAILPIALLMGALLLGGMVLAWRVGGRIARTVRELLPGAATGASAPSFREAQQVGAAFSALHADLRHHRRQLETLVAERTNQLERSRAQLDTLYATAPVGLSYVDSALRIVRINDFLAALNNRSVTDHLGLPIGELIADPEVRRQVLRDYRTVIESGQALTGIERSGYTAASPQQLCHWVISYYPQFGSDGKLSAITSLLLDITPQKRVETELHASKQLLKSVVENVPAMIFLKRASDLRYDLFNRYGAQLLGIPAEHIIGRNDAELISQEQAASFRAVDLQVLDSDQVLEIADEPLTGADGALHHLTTRKVALRDDQGRATHVLGMSLDITERKQAEQVLQATTARLAQSEHFVRAVTDNLPGMVAYWDATLRCRFANRYFLEWHQQDAQQIHGALMPDVMGAEAFATSAPFVDAALAGQPQGFPGQLAWPSGELSYTWTNYIPDLDAQAVVRGFFVLVSDVTELKETEFHLQQLNDELILARDRAEAASRAKSAFLANMSHEIRTPMNAIIGLTRLLEEAPLPERERSQLGKIQLATQSLLGVVNDVLDFSRIEAGQLQLEQTRFQL
ncbi:MAG: PAS domain-containing protein, partial [Sphingomonadaceae bacterium]